MKNLYLLSMVFLLIPINIMAQIGWYSSATTTDELNTVFFVDSLHGWVGGTLTPNGAGVIRRTTDGGATWVSQTLPVTDAINRILFLTSSIGFAVGGNGAILKTTDAGITWVQKRSGTGLESIFFFDSQHGWVCGFDTVLSTTDQGTTWSASLAAGAIDLWDISFRTLQEGWAVGLYSGCYKSTNSGESWNTTTPPITGVSLFGVRFQSPSNGIVIGGGQIALTTDAGGSWKSVYNSGGSQLMSVSFSDSLNGLVAGSDKIVKTTDGGSTWHEQPWQPYHYLNAVYCSDRFHAWAVGDQLILKTTDGGGVSSVRSSKETIPNDVALYQNYPNPFNPSTTISFSVANQSFVTLKVFDVLGREVSMLASEDLSAGTYTHQWNAATLPSGVYFYHIQAGSFSETKKCILVK